MWVKEGKLRTGVWVKEGKLRTGVWVIIFRQGYDCGRVPAVIKNQDTF